MSLIVSEPDFNAAINTWKKTHLDCIISGDVDTLKHSDKALMVCLHTQLKNRCVPLVYQYTISEHNIINGAVRLLDINVRDLSLVVNNREINGEKFIVRRNLRGSTARMVNKYLKSEVGDNYLERLEAKLARYSEVAA